MNSYLQERVDNEYYIDILGKVHKYVGDLSELELSDGLHYLIAYGLFPAVSRPRDYVYNLGWIKISNITGIKYKYTATQAQLNTLDSLGFNAEAFIKKEGD